MCQESLSRWLWQFGRHYSASGAGSAFGAFAGAGFALTGDGHGWLSTLPIVFFFHYWLTLELDSATTAFGSDHVILEDVFDVYAWAFCHCASK